jgi:5-methylcytosine-specific restriction endonuclease McrA
MTTYYENRLTGKYWQDQRQAVLNRDGGCVKCGNDDAKTVHHIIPCREFDSEEAAHDLTNLLTVCPHSCHWEIEDMSVEEQKEFLPNC